MATLTIKCEKCGDNFKWVEKTGNRHGHGMPPHLCKNCSGRGATNSIKERLIQQRGKTCQKCKATTKVILHHIDFNINNNEEANLLLLCWSCHNSIEGSLVSMLPIEQVVMMTKQWLATEKIQTK